MKIVRRGGQWCVTSGATTYGCHDTEAQARAQLHAVERLAQAPARAQRYERPAGGVTKAPEARRGDLPMSQPFQDAYERRVRIRKAGGEPTPLPADLEQVQTQLVADVTASLLAEDPMAAVRTAIREAAAQIIAKAIADLEAGRPAPTQKGQTMDATEYVTKGGPTWQRIEALAAQRIQKTPGTMTPRQRAAAVSEFLETPDGKTLYDAYTAEQAAVATNEARRRRDGGR